MLTDPVDLPNFVWWTLKRAVSRRQVSSRVKETVSGVASLAISLETARQRRMNYFRGEYETRSYQTDERN